MSEVRNDGLEVVLACALDEADYSIEFGSMISVSDAINYIAFGRPEGPERVAPWVRFHRLYPSEREFEEGARYTARRILAHAIKRGSLQCFTLGERQIDGIDNIELLRVNSKIFSSGVHIVENYDKEDSSYLYSISSIDDNELTLIDPIFILDQIEQIAPPLIESIDFTTSGANVPSAVRDRARGGRRAGTNGAPITSFTLKLQSAGREAVIAMKAAELGAMLRQEYADAGLREPNIDNSERDALGVRKVLFGED